MKLSAFKCQYSDLRLPDWLLDIDEDIDVTILDFTHNQLIADNEGGTSRFFVPTATTETSPLFVVISGRLELFDLVPNDEILAYRPIRVLTPGDMFGNFEILDKFYSGQDFNPILKETWFLAAGHYCIIPIIKSGKLKQNKKPGSRPLEQILGFRSIHAPTASRGHLYRQEDHRFYPFVTRKYQHVSLDIDENRRAAQVACIQISQDYLRKSAKLFYGLLELSWKHAQAYRFSINSFNLQSLSVYRSEISMQRRNLQEREKHRYSSDWPSKILPNIVVDALMDTLNRPIRLEPCYSFVETNELSLIESSSYSDKELLIATPSFDSTPFYYPFDHYNHIISQRMNEVTTNMRLIHDVFTHREPKVKPDEKPKIPVNGLKYSVLYETHIALVKSLIQKFSEMHPGYPYNVDLAFFGENIFLSFELK
jgi:hypothetical protein